VTLLTLADLQTVVAPIVAELRGIRLALERAIEPPSASRECLHPPDQRVHFGAMGSGSEFYCRACGAHLVAESAAT
jgi:hypothetical protein